jgi:putative two-component system response regulator
MDVFNPVKHTILIVDASATHLSSLSKLLQQSYTVKTSSHGIKALEIAIDEQPDLIILNSKLPDMDGYEVCRQLKAASHACHIPVLFLSSHHEANSEELAMALGAVDHITWPVNPAILLSRVRAHLADALTNRNLRLNNEYLDYEMRKRSRQLVTLHESSILALAALAEVRDTDTGNHLRRTQHYMRALGRCLQNHPRFSAFLSEHMIDTLFKCAPLHDIGKVGIPDCILLKQGRLEAEEYEIMKNHPKLGWLALNQVQNAVGQSLEFLEIAKQIVLSHHEKWDGSGYPNGLAGDAIPIPARLMALADVYDALVNRRVYKQSMSHTKAMDIILSNSATHFDPDVANAFLTVNDEFESIATRFADPNYDLEFKASTLGMMAQKQPSSSMYAT